MEWNGMEWNGIEWKDSEGKGRRLGKKKMKGGIKV